MQTEFRFLVNSSSNSIPRTKTVPTRRCRDIHTYLEQLQFQLLEGYKVLEKSKDHYWVELTFENGFTLTVKMER